MATTIALAGRRIDADGTPTPRFPLARVAVVADRIAAALARHAPAHLVCSAACGSDLIAIEQAAAEGIDTTIVLPFDAVRFRASSVTDRPGDWGPMYDGAIARAEAAGRLVIVDDVPGTSHDARYAQASDRIVDRALALAGSPTELVALAVWDGEPRGAGDLTVRFMRYAERAGARVETIPIGAG